MSWLFTTEGTPPEVKAAFEDYIHATPLAPQRERNARTKAFDIVVELGKGYSADWKMSVTASGSASIVDGKEVNGMINVSITPVPVPVPV